MGFKIDKIKTSFVNGQKNQAYNQIKEYGQNEFFVDFANDIENSNEYFQNKEIPLFIEITKFYFYKESLA